MSSPATPTASQVDANVLGRVFRGLSANAYGQLVTVVVQLLGVPILLHFWGTRLYGEWLVLFAIPAYLSMTDLGFSQSAANDMTARVGRDDRDGALAVFQSLVVGVYATVIIALIAAGALLWYFPIEAWLNLRVMSASTVRWVLWFAAVEVLVALPDGVTHAGFRAAGDYALHVSLNSTTRLLQFAGVWVTAFAGGGPIAAAATFCAVRALSTPALAVLLGVRHPWLRIGTSRARVHELRLLLKPALANLAFPCAQALNIQGMVLVVGAVLGPISVVVFTTLRTLTRLASQLVLVVSHAAEPELATAHGAGDRRLTRALFVHVLRAGLWLALPAAGLLVLLGGWVVEVWTHGQVRMNQLLFCSLLGSALATVVWYSALTVLKAANQHLRAASAYVVAATATLGSAILLLMVTHDVAGAGFALLIMDVGMAVFCLRAVSVFLDVSLLRNVLSAANPYPLLLLKGHSLVGR